MKKFRTILMLLTVILVTTACDNSIQRANNTIGLVQEKVTKITSDLYEIQNAENNLQSDFETDLANTNDQLSYFTQDSIATMQNVKHRTEHIQDIEKSMKELKELGQELINTTKNTQLPANNFTTLNTMIENLETDINNYTTAYTKNLALESQTFKAIGNPETNYSTFFKVFDNINLISEENLYNLDIVLKHFEPLNSLLVDTKVQVISLLEK